MAQAKVKAKLKKAGTKKQKQHPPLETAELRAALREFFQQPFDNDPNTGDPRHIGGFKWGVYIFYDYDGEPIYVGQTKEQVSQRISRHLTNQRTDAVAMSVLDPFEVFKIRVYPLPQFEGVNAKHTDYDDAKAHLDALEYHVHRLAIDTSKFRAILNEKNPPDPTVEIEIPPFLEGQIVTEKVFELRSHKDVRIARRSQIIARLAQTISEREVKNGLRQTLVTQAKRLRWLSEQRFEELGGKLFVEKGPEENEQDEDNT